MKKITEVEVEVANKNYDRLWQKLRPFSKSQIWDVARLEWYEVDMWTLEDSNCECGRDILNVFMVKNSITHFEKEVGSECIETLTGREAKKAFSNFASISKKPQKSLNKAALIYLIEFGVIYNPNEISFLTDCMGKGFKKLSPKQQAWRLSVNKRVLAFLSRRKSGSTLLKQSDTR